MSTCFTHKTISGHAAALLGLGLMAVGGCVEDDEPADADVTDEEGEAAEPRVLDPLPDTRLPTSLNTPVAGPAFSEVVATTEPLAAEAGLTILEMGGNAIDAAYAVQAALNVVEPHRSGIGGGAMWMIYLAPTTGNPQGQVKVLDCREFAPGASTLTMLQGSTSDLKSTSGISVGVPGALRCMEYAREHWGTLSRTNLLVPAIALADPPGFPISSELADAIDSSKLSNEPGNPAYDEARKVFRPGGQLLEEGDYLVQSDLADTFRLIAQGGLAAFYGDCDDVAPLSIADAIIATQRARRSSYTGGTGMMACSDLTKYMQDGLRVSEPLSLDYHGYVVKTTPPPTSGVHLLQMLGLLDDFHLGSPGFGFGEFLTLNVMQETMRLAFADRSFWLGDPEFVSVPTAGLYNDGYLDDRRALITPGKRRSKIFPGTPPGAPSGVMLAKQKAKDEPEAAGTTHWVVADAHGNVVSVTSTISDLWGTGLMVKGYGFMLNDQLLNFNDTPTASVKPYDPGANDVAPYKKPRTTVAPTMVFLQGELVATFGTPGGTTIINTLLEFFVDLADYRFTLQNSVVRPRFSLDSASSTAKTEIEPGFAQSVRKQLQKLGYKFTTENEIGAVQAAIINPADDKKFATADPRRIGAVEGILIDSP